MRGVDAGVGQDEAFDGTAFQEVLFDDLGNVLEFYEAIPGLLGIDDDGDAVLALVEATGIVDADPGAQSVLFDSVLERLADGSAALGAAAATAMARLALVDADENMSFKFGQG